MAILEAACYGKPTIGPAHGGFTEIIGRGEQAIGDLFEPNNLDDLERKVVSLWNRPDEIARLGEKAFEKLKREYSSEVIYQKWDNLFLYLPLFISLTANSACASKAAWPLIILPFSSNTPRFFRCACKASARSRFHDNIPMFVIL